MTKSKKMMLTLAVGITLLSSTCFAATGYSSGHTEGVLESVSMGTSNGHSIGHSSNTSTGENWAGKAGESHGTSVSVSTSSNEGISESNGTSISGASDESYGVSMGHSHGVSVGTSISSPTGESSSIAQGHSQGESTGITESTTTLSTDNKGSVSSSSVGTVSSTINPIDLSLIQTVEQAVADGSYPATTTSSLAAAAGCIAQKLPDNAAKAIMERAAAGDTSAMATIAKNNFGFVDRFASSEERKAITEILNGKTGTTETATPEPSKTVEEPLIGEVAVVEGGIATTNPTKAFVKGLLQSQGISQNENAGTAAGVVWMTAAASGIAKVSTKNKKTN